MTKWPEMMEGDIWGENEEGQAKRTGWISGNGRARCGGDIIKNMRTKSGRMVDCDGVGDSILIWFDLTQFCWGSCGYVGRCDAAGREGGGNACCCSSSISFCTGDVPCARRCVWFSKYE